LLVSVIRNIRTSASISVIVEQTQENNIKPCLHETKILSFFQNFVFLSIYSIIHTTRRFSTFWKGGNEHVQEYCFRNWLIYHMLIKQHKIWLLPLYSQITTSVNSLVYIDHIFIRICHIYVKSALNSL